MLLLCAATKAQDSLTTVEIAEVEVKQIKFMEFKNPYDSVLLLEEKTANLNEFLSEHSGVYVREFGKGLSGSVSLRGGSPQQTKIFWNGFEQTSTSLGQTDISLYSMYDVDQASVSYSGINSGMAGSINLSNNPSYNKGFFGGVGTRIGSFKNTNTSVKFGYSNKKLYSSSTINFQSAENQFNILDSYFDANFTQRDTIAEQSNAKFTRIGFQQVYGLRLKKGCDLKIAYKFHKANRNLPATENSFFQTQKQKDDLHNIVATWDKSLGTNWGFTLQTGYLRYKTNYFQDSTITNGDVTKNDAVRNSFNIKYKKSRIKWQALLAWDFEQASSQNYDAVKTRDVAKFYTGAEYAFANIPLDAKLGFKQEIYQSELSPFMPEVFLHFRPKKPIAKVGVELHYVRNYRYPELNALWFGDAFSLGNTNLLPEKSHNMDFSFTVDAKTKGKNPVTFSNNMTLFSAVIDNWIQYQPDINFIFSPVNYQKVYTRGLDETFKLGYEKGMFELTSLWNYSVTRVSLREELGVRSNFRDEQLIYVPVHNFSNLNKFDFDYLGFKLQQKYWSERYTSVDNSRFYDPTFLLDMGLFKTFEIGEMHNLYLEFEIKNITDQLYRTASFGGLPGRNYAFNLIYSFN